MPFFGLFGPPDVEKLLAWGKVKGLIRALSYRKDHRIRQEAAYALERIGNTQAVEPLIAAFDDEEADVRRSVALALGHLGDVRALDSLIASLKDKDRGVRKAAADAVGQLGDVRAVKPLVAALKDQDKEVRKSATEALAQIGIPAIESLVIALENESTEVREVAAEALGKLDWKPDRDRVGAIYWMTKDQWDQCARIGKPAVEPLIAALESGS